MYFKNEIRHDFSNHQLLLIFKKCRRILLFLFEEQLIIMDNFIYWSLNYEKNTPYVLYFYSYSDNYIICQFYLDNISLFEDDFENKVKIGENDSYLCELIRNDSINAFIEYINKTSIKLSSKIEPSVFETNYFLIENDPTIIEYAAFFGSIQIFKFLILNDIELTSSLWLYAIHGKSPEIIHLLEEYNVEPEDKTYEKCLKEAIKCHHNDIANYIINNLLDQNVEYNFKENLFAYCFHYYNFELLPDELDNEFTFFYLCKYDYYELVKLFIENKEIDLKKTIEIISKLINEILFFF